MCRGVRKYYNTGRVMKKVSLEPCSPERVLAAEPQRWSCSRVSPAPRFNPSLAVGAGPPVDRLPQPACPKWRQVVVVAGLKRVVSK